MNAALPLPFGGGMPVGALDLSAWTMLAGSDLGLAFGAILTLGGLVLHTRTARQRMSAEEGMKDGRLTEAQAVLIIRVSTFAAPALTLLGAIVMVVGLAAHLR